MPCLAIDYDGTFSREPQAVQATIEAFKSRGWTVICATARRKEFDKGFEIERQIASMVDAVVWCDNGPKGEACRKAGFNPDIILDNKPEAW